MNEPDYKNYTQDELLDAHSHINKEKYPERVKKLELEIEMRKNVKIDTSKAKANNNTIKKSDINRKTSIISNRVQPSNNYIQGKKYGILGSLEINDMKGAKRAIRNGWIAGTVGGLILLLPNLVILFNKNPNINVSVNFTSYIEIIIFFSLSFGIYLKKKLCAIALTAYIILSALYSIFILGRQSYSLLELILIFFISTSAYGIDKYHQYKVNV